MPVARIAVLSVLSLATLLAADATIPGTVTAPNPTTCGISLVWPFSGDDDGNGRVTVRSQATGKEYKRVTTAEEQKKMADLVTQEMQSGGLGLSSGLEYDPGFYSTTDELIACAKAAAKYHGIYISHVRDEGNEAIKSFEELITIAEKGHLPAQISHIKLDTSPSWGKASEVLNIIDAANKRGVDISVDSKAWARDNSSAAQAQAREASTASQSD